MATKKTAAKTATNKSMSPEDALEVLKEVQSQNVDACKAEIAEALKKYGCTMDVKMLISAGAVQPILSIVPTAPKE